MPITKVVRYEFVCDSCRHIRIMENNNLPRRWKRVRSAEGKTLMLCDSCASQFEKAFVVLGLEQTWLQAQV